MSNNAHLNSVKYYSVIFDESSPDDYYCDENNFISSCLVDTILRQSTWNYIIQNLKYIKTPLKREGICIGVFECAVEDQAVYDWLRVLHLLLLEPKFYWVITRSYKFQSKKKLLKDISSIEKIYGS
jgi:hypothetical protein